MRASILRRHTEEEEVMGLFRNTHVVGSHRTVHELDENKCGTTCPQCNKGKCNKSYHSSMTDHKCGGRDGCGNTWN